MDPGCNDFVQYRPEPGKPTEIRRPADPNVYQKPRVPIDALTFSWPKFSRSPGSILIVRRNRKGMAPPWRHL